MSTLATVDCCHGNGHLLNIRPKRKRSLIALSAWFYFGSVGSVFWGWVQRVDCHGAAGPLANTKDFNFSLLSAINKHWTLWESGIVPILLNCILNLIFWFQHCFKTFLKHFPILLAKYHVCVSIFFKHCNRKYWP